MASTNPIPQSSPAEHRRYERIRAPKSFAVGWKSSGQNKVSRAGSLSLGGIYIYTEIPPSVGSTIEMVSSVGNGYMRARGVVRRTVEGKGMGVEFVYMRPEDRSRWNQFLIRQKQTETETVDPPKTA